MTDRLRRCSDALLQCAVQKLSAGVSKDAVCREYGISANELSACLPRFGTMPILDADLLVRIEKEQSDQQRKQK